MDKQWLLYILECKDGTLYTGVTNDLKRRLAAHNAGKGAKYTRGRGPLKLRYVEACIDHVDALQKEISVKKLTTAEKWILCEEHGTSEVI